MAKSFSNEDKMDILKADMREQFRMFVEDIISTLYNEEMIEQPKFSSLPLLFQKKINEYCIVFETEPFSINSVPTCTKKSKQRDDTLDKSLEGLWRLSEAIDCLIPLIEDSIKQSNIVDENYEKKNKATQAIRETMEDLGLVKKLTHAQPSSTLLVSDAYFKIGKYLSILQPLVEDTVSRTIGQRVVEELRNDGLFNKIANYFNQTNRGEE